MVFGPSPRSFDVKVSKKVKRSALRSALTLKLREEKLLVVDRIDVDEIMTKKFLTVLQNLQLNNALFVTESPDLNLQMSARNVQGTKVLPSVGLNVYDILKYDHLVLVEPSIRRIEERLAQ